MAYVEKEITEELNVQSVQKEERTPYYCDDCNVKKEIPRGSRFCPFCGADCGFPNVRSALDPLEVSALTERFARAREEAKLGKFEQTLNCFEEKVFKESKAVHVCNINNAIKLLSLNELIPTYHQAISAGARLPAGSHWDDGRMAAESTHHYDSYGKIFYAALSFTNRGIECWGDFHLLLDERFINKRASAFEKNSFIFNEHHVVIAGKRPPLGYKAPWNKRAVLAVAKLYKKFCDNPDEENFQNILLFQHETPEKNDFIEIHIYESISPIAVKEISGPANPDKFNTVMLVQIKRALQEHRQGLERKLCMH